MEKQKIQILWFKKNLRVEDNEILANLNPSIPTLAVYFFEKDIIENPDYSWFHTKFITDSLEDLTKHLKRLNIPLLTLESTLPDGFEYICKYYDISHIFAHEETGNDISYKRDMRVLAWCKSSAINITEYPTNGVVRRLKSRDTWSKIWYERMLWDICIPQKVASKLTLPQELVDISAQVYKKYKKESGDFQYLQKWWEIAGKKVLKDFLTKRGQSYMFHISKPYESILSCSRLSPYITYGCLSVKTIFQATRSRIAELEQVPSNSAKNFKKSLEFFLARLHWQSHFIQKLEDDPSIEWKNLNPEFDSIRNTEDTLLLDSIFRAQSGIPYIDATIRQLQKTGWCNFRSRAILISFLCNTCMQPWQSVWPRLAKLFLDYEPGIHYSQIQMQAGTSGINTIRIYNPILNGKEKDAEGNFIKTFLPELLGIPDEFLYEPWKYERFDEIDYPKPIIDVESANRSARKILWEIKWNTPKETKQKIYQKHGSRAFRAKRQTSQSMQNKDNRKNSLSETITKIQKIRRWDALLQTSLF